MQVVTLIRDISIILLAVVSIIVGILMVLLILGDSESDQHAPAGCEAHTGLGQRDREHGKGHDRFRQ